MAEQLESGEETKAARSYALKSGLAFDEARYEFMDRFVPASGADPHELHTTPELVAFLEKNKDVEIDARVLAVKPGKKGFSVSRMNREAFLSNYQKGNSVFREGFDAFAYDEPTGNRVGDDTVNLLGGPFNKQLYIYDYLRMHAYAFHAYHHDPIAKAAVQTIIDFTLGRGYRVDCQDKKALALWRAFEEANDLQERVRQAALELSIYGETMIWWLPDNATKIGYKLAPGQEVPKGLLPRIRLIDPSVIWEVVTYPEDQERILYYQWVAQTQYSIYTGRDGGQTVPNSKFIYQQLPADQVMHFKVNSVSNEKRGRSDLFPVLGYLKRLRDSVNYSIIGMQKASAWAIDTTIEGSQNDIDRYTQDMLAQSTFAPAGSEFVHTSKIKRQYLSNEGASRGGNSQAFEWTLSMIASGVGIPINYFGTHLSGGQTRASAITATEPVTKRFEMRQGVYERMIKAIAKRFFAQFGMSPEIEVTFPDLITADRSAKLKDLALAETQGWITKERAANIAAKELGITEFEFEQEQEETAPQPQVQSPLSSPGVKGLTPGDEKSGLTSEEKRKVKVSNGY